MTPELDERYSDEKTTAVPWADVVRVLEDAQLSWITTVRADGRPHVTPLVAVWLDDALHFGTGPHEQKAKNLAANPHVVLSTGCNTWNDGLDVMVEGEARRVTDDAQLERLARAWGAKWDGRWKFGVGDGAFTHQPGDFQEGAEAAYVFTVQPTQVLAFGKGEFTHTRYRPSTAR
jgi:nitroimidazol reductase NimA-like FMN-containing flavoprotein (pyridoxamine 5'-phosphate oxidase superfamily)